jgi:rRNA maturation endonuclease Nob1
VNINNVDARGDFEATASMYRRRKTQVSFALLPLVAVWIVLVLYRAPAALMIITFVGILTVGFLSDRMLPELTCPACKLDANCEPVRFCPECGASDLQKKGQDKYFLAWPRCRGCGKALRIGKGGRRQYRIHFCTRCGAYLDEEGIECRTRGWRQ